MSIWLAYKVYDILFAYIAHKLIGCDDHI